MPIKKSTADNNKASSAQSVSDAVQMDTSSSGAILREVQRLQSDNEVLKSKNLKVWSAFIVLASLLTFTIMAVVSWFPKYRYIPTLDNSGICEVNSETSTRVTPATVLDFGREAVVNAYSYDYINYRETMGEVANKWFTDNGRKAFFASLDESHNLERVIKGRLILRTMATQVAQLEEEGLKANLSKYWVIHVPIAIEFYAGGDDQPKSRQDFIAVVTVVQLKASAKNLKGIAVDSIVLKPTTIKR
jgi:intracellular multiplication protein IcmL